MQAPSQSSISGLPAVAADILERLRTRRPRVHCITNTVAQAFTANVLLAAGCVPSMTIAPEEVAAFVGGADALLVNLGTCDAERRQAIGIAVGAAKCPWVLDPVFVDRSPPRAAFAKELAGKAPKVVRLNAAEFTTLAGAAPDDAALAQYARVNGFVVALSGRTDRVGDGTRSAGLRNGHEWMARVTAMGCAVSAVTAACLAVEEDAWHAAIAALLIVGIAGEVAANRSNGPGTFAAAILDALHALDGGTLIRHARVDA